MYNEITITLCGGIHLELSSQTELISLIVFEIQGIPGVVPHNVLGYTISEFLVSFLKETVMALGLSLIHNLYFFMQNDENRVPFVMTVILIKKLDTVLTSVPMFQITLQVLWEICL